VDCICPARNDNTIPFAVGEFHFTCKIFAFIVPLFSNNELNYVKTEEYDMFWRTFKHYDKSKGWAFVDYSNDKKKDFFLNLKFRLKEQKDK